MASLGTFSWDQFHFLRPELLWMFAPILVIVMFRLFSFREEIKWKRFIPKHLQPYMIQKGSQSKELIWNIGLLFTIVLCVFGISGPTWEKIEVPGKIMESPLVLILDMSQSMLATDIQPNRLERAKFKINDLLAAKPGARVALIGYSGSAHVIIPLTNDYELVKSHSNELSPRIMPLPGSDLLRGLELAKSMCEGIAAPATFVVLTDAIDKGTFTALQKSTIDGNFTIKLMPFNTVSGSHVPTRYSKKPLKDKQGALVHSSLNLEVLERINALEKVQVQELTLDTSDVDGIAEYVRMHLKFTDEDKEKEDDWQDKGLLCALPLLFFVLIYFRKGMVLVIPVFVTLLASCTSDFQMVDLVLTRDYQGQLLYEEQNYSEASGLFKSPIHKGNALYKNEDYKEAILYFKKDTTALGKYNLGLAHFKQGDYAAAALAFEMAVAIDSTFELAIKNKNKVQKLVAGESAISLKDAEEATKNGPAKNKQNDSPEDLSGGGDEATDEQMEKERMEETTNTDIRKGKELDELPEDFELGKDKGGPKVMMQKVDDDPSLFLKRKFLHQVKTKRTVRNTNLDTW